MERNNHTQKCLEFFKIESKIDERFLLDSLSLESNDFIAKISTLDNETLVDFFGMLIDYNTEAGWRNWENELEKLIDCREVLLTRLR